MADRPVGMTGSFPAMLQSIMGAMGAEQPYGMTPHGAAMPGGEYGGTGDASTPMLDAQSGLPIQDTPDIPVPNGPEMNPFQKIMAQLGPIMGAAGQTSQAPPGAGPQVGNQVQVDPDIADQENVDNLFHQYVDLAKGVTPENIEAEAQARLHQKGYDKFVPGQDHGFHKVIRRILAGVQGLNDALQDPKGRYADGSKHDIMSAIHRSDIGADKQEEYDAKLETEKKKVLAEKIGKLTIAKGVLDESQQNANNSSVARKRIADIAKGEEDIKVKQDRIALDEKKLDLKTKTEGEKKQARDIAQKSLDNWRTERLKLEGQRNEILKKKGGSQKHYDWDKPPEEYEQEFSAAMDALDSAYEAKKQAIAAEDPTAIGTADTAIASARAHIDALKSNKPKRIIVDGSGGGSGVGSGFGSPNGGRGFTRGGSTVQKKPNSPFASGANAIPTSP